MGTMYSRWFSRVATAIVIAAATLPLTRLQAQPPAALDGPAGYNIGCSIEGASGIQDCGAPPQGHTCDVEGNYASQPSRESTGITFVNRSDKPIKIYWLNFRGDRILYKALPPGAQLAQQTFVGHNWLVTTSTEQCIGIFETIPQSIADDASVAVAPPELPIYEEPSPPGEDLVWTPGFWAWNEDARDYYWVPGTWAAAPIVGYLWTPGYWVARRGRFAWQAGYWGPHVGFYGGINYGHGYFGRGYVGGSWRDGRMMYNSAVSNLENLRSNHTYSQAVVDGASNPRASYSGAGAQPNTAEIDAARDIHIPPTTEQLRHIQAAGSYPSLRAGSNNGHPTYAATTRPGEILNPAPPPAQHAGTLSITHSAPAPRPVQSVAVEKSHHDTPAAATSAAVHKNPVRAQPLQEQAAQSTTESQPAPKENQQSHPKSSPTAPRAAAPHTEAKHTP
jgi:hypothetical protein